MPLNCSRMSNSVRALAPNGSQKIQQEGSDFHWKGDSSGENNPIDELQHEDQTAPKVNYDIGASAAGRERSDDDSKQQHSQDVIEAAKMIHEGLQSLSCISLFHSAHVVSADV